MGEMKRMEKESPVSFNMGQKEKRETVICTGREM